RLAEVPVHAEGDPVRVCLRERPVPARALMAVHLYPHLAHPGLQRGQVDLAVGLKRVGVAREDLAAGLPDGNVEDAALLQFTEVEVAGVLPRRHGADDPRRDPANDLAVLWRRQTESSLERPERERDRGGKLRD